MEFEEVATRDQVWLRNYNMGPTGSGKSEGSLMLATALSRYFGGELPVTLVNSERGRGKLYADRYRFGYIGLDEDGDFSPEAYVRALDLVEGKRPGGIIVVDGVSHEWMGANGVLQQADRFGDWKTVRPKHNAFVDRLIACESHVICTVRAKMKYEVTEEEVPGRAKPRQVVTMLGVGPIQSDDLQYEFNLVGRFDLDTKEVTFSGHVDPLLGTTWNLRESADEVAEKLGKWLSEGNPIEPPPAASDEDVASLREALLAAGYDEATIEQGFTVARRKNRGQLHPEFVSSRMVAALDKIKANQGNGAGAAAAEEVAAAEPGAK